jgi:hypothetical protein
MANNTNSKHHSFGILWFLLGALVSTVAFLAIKKSQEEDDAWADPWENSSEPAEKDFSLESLDSDIEEGK